MEVVLSPPTNKEIIDNGVRETVNDACIPIKVFHGHVQTLKNKVDFIFLPRMVSIDGKATMCPKFLGLPDMVKNSIENLPTLIVDNFNMKHYFALERFFLRVGRRFTNNIWLIWRAYYKGLNHWRQYRKQLLDGFYPQTSKDKGSAGIKMVENLHEGGRLKLGVLAYPYVIYDTYLSVNLLSKLKEIGVDLYLVDGIHPSMEKKARKMLPMDLFWYYSNKVVWSALYYLNQDKMDGIIHVTAFGCGPDAMVDKLVELEAKKAGVPFMAVTIDEHTGETGMQTRLEAFIDMLRNKKGIEVP